MTAEMRQQAEELGQFHGTCYLACQLLQDEEVRRWVARTYPLVLVDEAQDLDIHRQGIILGLKECCTAVVAADSFQCLALFVAVDDGGERAGQAELEARILAVQGRKEEAAALLGENFTETLASSLLKEHLKLLPDFEDLSAEERAMAHALTHQDTMAALQFFLAWPRRDLAARLIVERHTAWRGEDWHILPKLANRLQHEHPLAASILFRVLLEDILGRARSKAYGHGAKYLRQLDQLATDADADPSRPETFCYDEESRQTVFLRGWQ